MAVWECAECTAKYSVGAPRCPQCGSVVRVNESTRPDEQEENSMPKVTVHGGASVEGFEVDPEHGELTPAEGGEESSPGSSSETSSAKPETAPEPSETPSPSPARKTASRSKKGQTDSSSAAGTDGAPEDGTSATDA